MGSLKSLVLAGAAAFATIPAAYAADMGPLIPKFQGPVEEFGGWYLRGDIGWSNQRLKDYSQNGFGANPLPASVSIVSGDFENAGIFGLGIGFQFNNWLRFDVTGEYRGNSTFHGFDIVTATDGTLIPEHQTLIKSEWVFLGNAYIDLGTWWGFTPFVGAGAGIANVQLSSFQDLAVGSLNPVTGAAFINGNNFAGTGNKWNFAWAIHAGLAYKVTPNFTVELAYRYLDLGDGVTGSPIQGFDGTTQGTDFHINNITSHDVKLGVRWLLWEPAAPIMRKG